MTDDYDWDTDEMGFVAEACQQCGSHAPMHHQLDRCPDCGTSVSSASTARATDGGRVSLRDRYPTLLCGEIDWETNWRVAENVRRKNAVKHRLLEPHVTDRTVLHVGCGGGTRGRPDDDAEWLHAWLDDQARACVGIDIDGDAVTAAQRAGYDVREANAQAFSLSQNFETVVATNVIEHVENPGAMLRCARDHLVEGGRVAITTDRPNIPWWTARELLGGADTPAEHCVWFDESTLDELCARVGLEMTHWEPWGYRRLGMSPADRAFATFERVLKHVPGLRAPHAMQQFAIAEVGADA